MQNTTPNTRNRSKANENYMDLVEEEAKYWVLTGSNRRKQVGREKI